MFTRNWMARELIPRLEKKSGGRVWCNDCHAASGKAGSKILKDPRSESFAIEWMTTHLVEDFSARGGAPLRCKSCHKGNLGSPEFQKKIILADEAPAPPTKSESASDAGAEPASDAAASGEALDAGAP